VPYIFSRKVLNDKKEPLDNIQIGDKFASIGDSPIFYAVTKINADLTVELTAEVNGCSANSVFGLIELHKLQKLMPLQGM